MGSRITYSEAKTITSQLKKRTDRQTEDGKTDSNCTWSGRDHGRQHDERRNYVVLLCRSG